VLTVVTSHWHNDHIVGNAVYRDSEIIMTARGLQSGMFPIWSK
jgi:hypothetical protein